MAIYYLNKLSQVTQLSGEKLEKLVPVEEKFKFRANKYYLSLIDWDDPNDPIRKIVIPSCDELESWGDIDASKEFQYTKLRGIQHKYPDTALLLVVNVCGTFCRFCFRKRLFYKESMETLSPDISDNLNYIREHCEITNVLLTGSDPLILATHKLGNIISELRKIEHVKIIRIGSKMPATNPYRILDDPTLPEMLRKYSLPEKKIYIITHFNHPRELTPAAIEALDILRNSGAILSNQTPLMRGINDNPDVLAKLLQKLSFIGNAPYYVFQVRPTIGNKPFAMPIVETYEIFQKAIAQVSGLAKRVKLIMSHFTGKLEIMAIADDSIILRYHRAAERSNEGRIMVFEAKPDAYWLDDLGEER